MPARRIKPSHIDDWIADMNQDGVSPTKVIEAVGVLRRVLDRAVRDKAIAQNSCTMRSGSLPKRPQTEHRCTRGFARNGRLILQSGWMRLSQRRMEEDRSLTSRPSATNGTGFCLVSER